MCENLMSEAELAVVEKVGAAGGANREDLEAAVEAAVKEGRDLMEHQEQRSVEEFNNDTEYSKMLHDAVQVRALPRIAPHCLVRGGQAKLRRAATESPRCS